MHDGECVDDKIGTSLAEEVLRKFLPWENIKFLLGVFIFGKGMSENMLMRGFYITSDRISFRLCLRDEEGAEDRIRTSLTQ